jgi:plastocyanin
MKLNDFAAAAAIVAGSIGMASAGDITGKVTLKGAVPPEPGLAQKTEAIKKDIFCGKVSEGPKNRVFVVGANGELGQVVIKLTEGVTGSAPAAGEPVVLDQKSCEYVPYVTAVQTGQKLLVRNSDEALHNVHALPKVAGNKETNKAQMAKSPDLTYAYENAEDFLTYKCDVHPWMFAYVSVVPHPYFAVSGADGSYTIKNVPDGKYKIEAAHRKAGKSVKDVEVKGGNASVNFELEVKPQ